MWGRLSLVGGSSWAFLPRFFLHLTRRVYLCHCVKQAYKTNKLIIIIILLKETIHKLTWREAKWLPRLFIYYWHRFLCGTKSEWDKWVLSVPSFKTFFCRDDTHYLDHVTVEIFVIEYVNLCCLQYHIMNACGLDNTK